MINVNANTFALNANIQRRERMLAEKENNVDKANRRQSLESSDQSEIENEGQSGRQQRMLMSPEEMSSSMSKLINRRNNEKKAGASEESDFDRVLDDEAPSKAQEIVSIVKSPYGRNIQALLKQIRSLFPDDSDLVLILRELIKNKELEEIERKRLKKILAQVEKKANPKKLKAGINVGLKARIFSRTLAIKPQLLRESYRQYLESDCAEVITYQEWVTIYGAQSRNIIIEFMEQALFTDINALDPSCSSIEFGELLSRMTQIKLFRSAECAFLGPLMKSELVNSVNNQEAAWLMFMLAIIQDPLSIEDCLADISGGGLVLNDNRQYLTLLQLIYRAFKTIPPRFFIEADDRDILDDEFRRCTDEAYSAKQHFQP
jgi:type III secretion system protein